MGVSRKKRSQCASVVVQFNFLINRHEKLIIDVSFVPDKTWCGNIGFPWCCFDSLFQLIMMQ